jgi:hypothetical protein
MVVEVGLEVEFQQAKKEKAFQKNSIARAKVRQLENKF